MSTVKLTCPCGGVEDYYDQYMKPEQIAELRDSFWARHKAHMEVKTTVPGFTILLAQRVNEIERWFLDHGYVQFQGKWTRAQDIKETT